MSLLSLILLCIFQFHHDMHGGPGGGPGGMPMGPDGMPPVMNGK